MIFDDCLAYELAALNFAFIDDNFMVLSQLNFVIFDCLVECFVPVVPFFDIVDDLQQIDRNRKYLSSSLQHFLILFDLFSVLTFELNLILAFSGWTTQDLIKFCV